MNEAEARIGIDFGGALPIEDAIAWAGDNDIRHIDVQIDADLMRLADGGPETEALRKQASERGVAVHLHTLSGMNMAEFSPFAAEAATRYLNAYIDAAAAIGAATVVVHGGYHFTADYDRRRAASLERLRHAIDRAAARNVVLMLENMNKEPADAEVKYLAHSLDECRYYFAQLPAPHIAWSFTVNHAHLLPEGIAGFVDGLDMSRCREVRIADCRGTVEEHLFPGDGTIDFADMFRRIERAGYRDRYTLAFGTPDDMLRGRAILACDLAMATGA